MCTDSHVAVVLDGAVSRTLDRGGSARLEEITETTYKSYTYGTFPFASLHESKDMIRTSLRISGTKDQVVSQNTSSFLSQSRIPSPFVDHHSMFITSSLTYSSFDLLYRPYIRRSVDALM